MALRFFWRCESETLDVTHDYTAGSDTTATPQNANVLIDTPGLAGSNAVHQIGDGRYYFDTDAGLVGGIVSEGSCAALVNFDSRNTNRSIFTLRSSNSQETIALRDGSDTGGFTLYYGDGVTNARALFLTPAAGTGTGSTGVTYGVVGRWRLEESGTVLRLRVEAYNTSSELISSIENTFTPPPDISAIETPYATGMQVAGNPSQTKRVDNVFLADSYSEPLEDNLFITSYTEYGAPAGPTHPFTSVTIS